VVKLSWLA